MLFGRMSKQVKVVMGQSYATPDALKTRSVSYGSRFSVQVFLLEPQRKSSSGLHLGSVSFCSCVSMRVCVSIQSSHFKIKKAFKDGTVSSLSSVRCEDALPRPEASLSVPRLGISRAHHGAPLGACICLWRLASSTIYWARLTVLLCL